MHFRPVPQPSKLQYPPLDPPVLEHSVLLKWYVLRLASNSADMVLQLAEKLLYCMRSSCAQAMWHFWPKSVLQDYVTLHCPVVTLISQASPNMKMVESTHW